MPRSVASEEDEPEADTDRGLDTLEREPEREAGRVGDAVAGQRQGDRRLHEPEVSRPERHDRGDVHQQEHEGRLRQRAEVECVHDRVDRGELQQPAGRLAEDRAGGGHGPVHHEQALPSHREDGAQPSHLVTDRSVVPSRAHDREGEQRRAEDRDDEQARHRPVRDLGGGEHVQDEKRHGHEVEEAVSDDGPEQGGARAAAVREGPPQHRHARQLADASGQCRIPEQADAEGGEGSPEAWQRRVERLAEHELPCQRAYDDRAEVQHHGNHDPAPLDEVEGVVDGAPIGAPPPDQQPGEGEERQHERHPKPGTARNSRASHAAARVDGRLATSS